MLMYYRISECDRLQAAERSIVADFDLSDLSGSESGDDLTADEPVHADEYVNLLLWCCTSMTLQVQPPTAARLHAGCLEIQMLPDVLTHTMSCHSFP